MTKLQRLSKVMYTMLKERVLDELDFDDFTVMIEALIIHWDLENELDIYHEGWKEFLNEINCKKSEDFKWFETKFINYIQII